MKFDGSNSTRLIKTFSSAGNRQSWTWSCWTKRDTLTRSDRQVIFGGYGASDDTDWLEIGWDSGADHVYFTTNSITADGTAQRRDPQGWYHFFSTYDGSTLKIYVNNRLDLSHSFTGNRGINVNGAHYIGQTPKNTANRYLYAKLSQCYFIDGQVLTPESFGYTDGLTNTWRPKKYEGVFNGDAVAAVSYSDNGQMSSSASFNAAPNDAAAGFDGSLDGGDVPYLGGSSAEIVWTPTGTLSYSSQIEIYVGGVSGFRYNLNNGGWNTTTINSWNTVSTGSGTITTIKVDRNGSATHGWHAIRIDGTILVNSPAQNAGVNGFNLPMDGNSPIGEDKSGQGNNWTPVNFGGSVALDKATGAKPILNTDGGGNVARVGVFGSEVGAYYAVTVSNPGSGNKYYLDGVLSANPTLTRGATYTFDQSDSSNSGHPLVFGTTAEGNNYSDGVTTNGTPGSAGAYTKITVPHNAPDTLYYHCSVHSGMGSSTSQITDETKADPYAWKNTLATPLVGSANDISNSVNSGSTTKTITVTNAVASSAVSNFYGGSWYFDGSGDYINASSNSDFTFGTGDFTIEGWVYPGNSDGGNKTIFSTNWGASGSILFTYDHTTNKGFDLYDHTTNAGSPIASTGGTYEANAWYHFAVVRNSNTSKIYINGIEAASASHNTNLTRDVFVFGAVYTNGTETWNGYQSDFRIYKGVAKYTSNFVVPSTSPDVLPDTPSGVSGGSKLAKVTDGAVSFDGTGDYLLSGASSDYSFGTGNFTIEGYIYPNSASGTQGIMGIGNAVSPACQIFYNVSNSQKVRFNVTDGTAIESTGTAPAKAWSHFAVVREGTGSNETKIYINGKLEAQGTISTNLTETTLQIGRPNTSSGTEYFNGVVSNFRESSKEPHSIHQTSHHQPENSQM